MAKTKIDVSRRNFLKKSAALGLERRGRAFHLPRCVRGFQ